jgi:predicted DNA-binding transcriptional regulator AlpA
MGPENRQFNAVESIEVARVAQMLDMSRVSVWRLIHNPDSGFPKPFRTDPTNPRSHLRIRLCELAQWIERQQQRTKAAGINSIHATRASRAGATE